MLDRSIEAETSDGGNAGSPGRPPGYPNQLQQELDVEGYAVVKDVLTPEQVQFLRGVMKKHLKSGGWFNYGGKFQVQAMHAVPGIAQVLTCDAVLDVLKQVTQPLEVVLTGECDLMINTTSTWHKDITHHPVYSDGRVFEDGGLPIYKVAFYLQDQGEASRATLKVRPRSHRLANGDHMPVSKAAVKAGDALIFDIRIDHLGQLPTLTDKMLRKALERVCPKLHVDAQKVFTRSRSVIRWFRRAAQDRMAIFLTFGPFNEWTLAYAEVSGHRHASIPETLGAEVLARLALCKVILPPAGLGPLI